jgi:hypothetical protein
MNNVACWFPLSMGKGSGKGFPMPETIIGETEGCANENNT